MILTHLTKILTETSEKLDRKVIFWLSLSLTFALIYSYLGLKEAFSGEWVVQDDARQHVFWMLRFLDPQLFPNDLIADYFQSVAPEGYSRLYHLGAILGINPLIFNKILPPILVIITTIYCFLFTWQIFPIPSASFIASLLLNQSLALKDDIISGTPRAFAYPLLMAFLYYLSKRSLLGSSIIIFLSGLFYPQCIFICSVMLILQLITWQNGKIKFSQNFADYRFCFVGLIVAFLVLLPFALTTSEFSPTITVEQAKQLPEFHQRGRSLFFVEDFFEFWFFGGRSGLLSDSISKPLTLILGIFLPVIISFCKNSILIKKIKPEIKLLTHFVIASIIMFFLAHFLLFKLHLPSRYTTYSFRIVFAVSAGISITILLEQIWRWGLNLSASLLNKRALLAWLVTIVIVITIFGYPSWVRKFPMTKYKTGNEPELYLFLQQQPKDILIASLASEITDNIPVFGQRSILVTREYAIPYQLGYYNQFTERMVDLIEAQYSTNPQNIIDFINKYQITFWGIEDHAFTAEYLERDRWLRQYQPVTQDATNSLKSGKIPILNEVKNSCTVLRVNDFSLLSTDCIKNKL
jgi:hypothetical protein